MRFGKNLAGALVVVTAAALGAAATSVRGGADDTTPPRGEIVIKPTGRKVRVVSVAPVRATGAAAQPTLVQLASAQVAGRP